MGFFKKDSKRQSVDFDRYELERLKAHRDKYHYSSISSLVSRLIDSFCNLDPVVLDRMAAACAKYSSELAEQSCDPDNDMEREHLRLMAYQYHQMELFFTSGNGYAEPSIPTAMQRIEMDNAFLLCPDDWVVVNPGDAPLSQFAYAVEIMHHRKFNMPYFVVFSDKDRFTESLEKIYIDSIKKMDSHYREVLDQEVPLYMDSNHKPINWKEHMASPWAGFYQIQDAGLSYYSYPYGAMIIRNVIGPSPKQ